MAVKKGYKQTEVGVIPDDWLIYGFNALASIPSGQVDPKQEPFRSMVLVAPDHIESGSGRLLKEETAAEQKAISGKYLFAPGDVLYSKIRPYLRKATVAEFSGLCSADMYPLRPSGRTCAGFLLGVILGYRFSKYAESVSVRSGMPKINRDELSTFYTAIPPTLHEQEAIAGALSDADAWIESLEQLIAKKRQIKQGAMQELLTGKRRLPGFSAEWEKTTLNDLGRWMGGMTPSMANGSYWDGGDFPWVSSGDVKSTRMMDTSQQITKKAIKESATTVMPAGSIIIVNRSGILRRYLPVSLLLRDMAINQDIKGVILKHGLVSDFVLYSLLNAGQTILSTCMKAGTTVESIELMWLKRFVIPIPSSAEQTAIATVLSNMDTEIESLESKLAKAREVKQGMMQELLTGRTRLI